LTAVGDENWHNKDFKAVLNDIDDELKINNHLLKYDLVLLDLYLTDKDKDIRISYETSEEDKLGEYTSSKIVKHIREKLKDKATPIVLFTASEKVYNVDKLRRLGVDDYIHKSIPYKNEDCKQYFKNFKNCIKTYVSQEREILREVWRSIRKYSNSNSADTLIIFQLTDAFELLKNYTETESIQLLKASLLIYSFYIEKKFNNDPLFGSHAFDELSLNIKTNNDRFYLFMVYQIRNTFVHSSLGLITL